MTNFPVSQTPVSAEDLDFLKQYERANPGGLEAANAAWQDAQPRQSLPVSAAPARSPAVERFLAGPPELLPDFDAIARRLAQHYARRAEAEGLRQWIKSKS